MSKISASCSYKIVLIEKKECNDVVTARSCVNEAFCKYESDPTKENEQNELENELLQDEKAKLKKYL